MAVTYRQNEGSRTTSRAISGIAGGVVTVGTALTTALVGDVAEIFSSSTGANNSTGYTIVAISGTTYTLRPAPLNQGASGSLVRLNRSTARTLGATAVTSVTVLGSGLAVIRVVGANFVTNGVQPSDRVPLSGSSISAHNGAWIVVSVLNEDEILVTAPDGGTGMTGEAVGTGTISARHGLYTMSITAEAALSWQRLLDVGVPENGPSGGAPFFAPSPISVLIRKELVGGFNTTGFNTRTLFRMYGLGTISIDQSGLGTPSTWNSQNEIAINARNALPGSGGALLSTRFAFLNTGSWGVGNTLNFFLGSQPGNRFSAADGSCWLGFFTASAQFNAGVAHFHVFGSTMDHVDNITILGDGDVAASIIRPVLQAWAGLVESVVAYGREGFAGNGAGDQNNILVASQALGSSVSGTGTVITGLLLSDQVLSPHLNNISGGLVTVLNPREDYDLALIARNLTAGSVVEKQYTFNPTFAAQDSLLPTPINGLTVTVEELNDALPIPVLVFSGTTNAQGRLNGGLGLQLRRQLLNNGNVVSSYSHRLTIQGAGFRLVRLLFQLVARAENTVTIPRILPDYEGELSR